MYLYVLQLSVCVCVCGAGFESLLEAVRIPDLSLLYNLFTRFKNGLPLISKAFANYIKVCVATLHQQPCLQERPLYTVHTCR